MANPNSKTMYKVFSMNVRGLRCARKRRTLFHNFRKENYDIICLQETYITNKDVSLIKKEWPYGVHLSEGTNKSKGLLTLFSKNINETSITLKLVNERCLISFINTDTSNILIANVYAPCVVSEKSTFLNNIYTQISSFCSDHLLLMGDFNTVLNNNLDIISGGKHNNKVVDNFNTLVNNLLVVDIWRVTHPLKKEFTWSKDNPFTARRIDFTLVSESLIPFCRDPNIKRIGFSDHKATTVVIDFSSFKRGPSTFKFNVSLLKNIDFVNEVTCEILRIKDLELNPHLAWEYIKISIKDLAMKYGRTLAFKKKK